MSTLWQWLTARWMAHRRRTRAARLAHVLWHERWEEPQAVHVPAQGDTLDGRRAEAVSFMLGAWW
jgi:hypothetical protein